jgi:hypothetical protein
MITRLMPHPVAVCATSTEIAHGNSQTVRSISAWPRAAKQGGDDISRNRHDGIPLKPTQLNKLVSRDQENDPRHSGRSISDSLEQVSRKKYFCRSE